MSNLLESRSLELPHLGQSFLTAPLLFSPFSTSRMFWSAPMLLLRGTYCSSTFLSGYPSRMRYDWTLSRWSPCRMIWLFLAVPPQAQAVLSLTASCPRLVSLSLRPSIMVTARPHLRVSKRTRIFCCSLLISSQTHISCGSPHIGQISAMALTLSLVLGLFKIFSLLSARMS